MKKTLIIALCCLVAVLAACKKKPIEPTPEPDPEPIDYAINYVGSYLGQFTLTVLTMNNEPVTNMSFPIEGIKISIAKGEEFNSVTATVTVENEVRQTTGTATEAKANFEVVHLIVDKPEQGYSLDLNIQMEGSKAENDNLNFSGSFTGNGYISFAGETQILDEVSGNLSGILALQPTPEKQ